MSKKTRPLLLVSQ